jgi:NAD(P)-dependent dehydrogenase (short-subunit alcohol dehydrogenase family)
MRTPFRLDGATAIVTGASSGIGADAAKALAAAGAAVVLVGRDEARLAAVDAEITQRGGQTQTLQVDVCSEDGPRRIVQEVIERFERIDVVVHAAGIFEPTPFEQTTDDILDRQWAVNVRAPFRLTRETTPHLQAGSAVIFVSSIAGHVGFPNSSAYCATKGAVELMVKALAMELAPRGIRVNAIAPGNIHTKMNAHLFAEPEYERQMLEATPAGRVGLVADISPAVVYLASPESDYVHGASLLIDGGWTAR